MSASEEECVRGYLASDAYSYGAMVFELTCCEYPYANDTYEAKDIKDEQLSDKLFGGSEEEGLIDPTLFSFGVRCLKLPVHTIECYNRHVGLPHCLYSLIRACSHFHWRKRPGMPRVVRYLEHLM